MQKIKHLIIALSLSIGVLTMTATPTVNAALPVSTSHFAACVNGTFLTFPSWFRGLKQDPTTCSIQLTQLNDIWRIVLNILDIALQVAGYLSVSYLIWGGFKYIKSQGNPQNIASAKSTLMNAAIGLGIALSAVAIVNFVQGTLKA